MVRKIIAGQYFQTYFGILATQMITFSYTLIDAFMIARVDNIKFAGFSQGGILVSVLLSFFTSFNYIIINSFIKKIDPSVTDDDEEQRYISTAFILSILLGTMMILAVSISGNVFAFAGVPSNIARIASEYSLVLSLGATISIFLNFTLSFSRSKSMHTLAIKCAILGALSNFALNWLVLFGPLKGFLDDHKALATTTIIAQIISLSFAIWKLKLFTKVISSISFFKADYLNQKHLLVLVWTKGFWIALRNLNDWLLSFILVLLVAKYGEEAIIANSVADTFSSTIYRFVQAGCGAIGILAAKEWGRTAREKLEVDHERRTVLHLIVYSATPVLVIAIASLLLLEEIAISFNINPTSSTYSLTLKLFKFHLAFLILYFFQHILSAILDSFLKTSVSGVSSTLVSYLIILPLALWTVHLQLGVQYVWISEAVGTFLLMVLYAYYLFKHLNKGKANHEL